MGNLAMLTREIADLTSLGKGGVASGCLESLASDCGDLERRSIYLATEKRIEMAKSTSAVAIGRNWSRVDVIDYFVISWSRISVPGGNIRNGPPEVGRFWKFTFNWTPIPSGLAVAETVPLMLPRGSSGLKKDFAGKVAI